MPTRAEAARRSTLTHLLLCVSLLSVGACATTDRFVLEDKSYVVARAQARPRLFTTAPPTEVYHSVGVIEIRRPIDARPTEISSAAMKVNASPVAAARPVRPILCT